MGFRRPFYAKGRLKVAWILYRTVAWALSTGDVCGNDGERSEVFPVFAGKALPIVPNGECQVWLTVFALSLALSHGERARERAKPFGLPLSRFSKNHPSKHRQKRWSGIDARPCSLISKA